MRFGMELYNASDIFASSGFMVFQNTLKSGGVIKFLVAPGCAEYTRKEVDNLTDFAKEQGAKGPGDPGADSRRCKGHRSEVHNT
jgi:aspartyl-tRNA synthetase